MDILIQILTASLGTLGFALFFNIKKEKLAYVAISGGITWCIYLICRHYGYNEFISNLISAAFTTVYAEIFARILKAPATVFLITGIVPLVPGGSLYYTMSSATLGNMEGLAHYGYLTLQISLGIAAGILIISTIVYHYNQFKYISKK